MKRIDSAERQNFDTAMEPVALHGCVVVVVVVVRVQLLDWGEVAAAWKQTKLRVAAGHRGACDPLDSVTVAVS